jgi:3-phenylpropionate/cinnamic acid dioxygenase small subunit
MSSATGSDLMAQTFAVTNLMARYSASLDRRELETWAEFFAPTSSYAIASSENFDEGLPLLLINDDTRSRIGDRVRYVREFWAGSFTDYASRHVLSTPVLLETSGSGVKFEQSFALYMTEPDMGSDGAGQSKLLCVGRYLGETTGPAEKPQLASLQVVLDTIALTRSLVYPV